MTQRKDGGWGEGVAGVSPIGSAEMEWRLPDWRLRLARHLTKRGKTRIDCTDPDLSLAVEMTLFQGSIEGPNGARGNVRPPRQLVPACQAFEI